MEHTAEATEAKQHRTASPQQPQQPQEEEEWEEGEEGNVLFASPVVKKLAEENKLGEQVERELVLCRKELATTREELAAESARREELEKENKDLRARLGCASAFASSLDEWDEEEEDEEEEEGEGGERERESRKGIC